MTEILKPLAATPPWVITLAMDVNTRQISLAANIPDEPEAMKAMLGALNFAQQYLQGLLIKILESPPLEEANEPE